MNSFPEFDLAQAASLRTYLDAPERTSGTMSYCEAAGFLFVVACAPEPIQPSQWIPIIVDPENSTETNIHNMQAVTNGLLSLYNETIRQVQEVDTKLPPGCDFTEQPMDNLESDSSISQWASGFRTGYLWLEEMWSEYIPEEIKEEAGHQMTVLCFFSNRQMANAFYSEVQNEEITFESMTASMQGIFPDAMRGFAMLGNSIQQVVSKRDKTQQSAVQGKKLGRNEPCHCGSGKKYKKCCGGVLH